MDANRQAAVAAANEQLTTAQSPYAIGEAIAALIIANNPQYAALAGLITAAINAILLGVPVQPAPVPAQPTNAGGLLGWFRRVILG